MFRSHIHRGEWSAALSILEQQPALLWYFLPPPEFRQLLGAIPAERRAWNDKARMFGSVLGVESESLDRIATSGAPGTASDTDAQIIGFAIQSGAFRLSGRLDEAMRLVDLSKGLITTSETALVDATGGLGPMLSLQHGITALLAGNFSAAHAWLSRAEDTSAGDTLGFVARDAALKLALLHALYGDPAIARAALQRAEHIQRTASWAEDWIDSTGQIARLALVVDGGGDVPPSFTSAPWRTFGEMWPFAATVSVRNHITAHDFQRALLLLRSIETAELPGLSGDGIPGSIVPILRARVHLASGQRHAAHVDLDRVSLTSPLGILVRAQLQLAFGELDAAEQTARAGLVDSAGFLTHSVQLALVLAAVELEKGHSDKARSILVETLAPLGVLPHSAGWALPSNLVEASRTIWADDPTIRDILADGGHRPFTVGQPTVLLTSREREILALLDSQLTANEVAEALFVSRNTLKTHLRNMYRKLGVANRQEAVAAALAIGASTPRD